MIAQGYTADHKDIDLLRLRSFTIGRSLSEEEVTKPTFMDRVTQLMEIMSPFVSGQVYPLLSHSKTDRSHRFIILTV